MEELLAELGVAKRCCWPTSAVSLLITIGSR